jgi:hypothetical protein
VLLLGVDLEAQLHALASVDAQRPEVEAAVVVRDDRGTESDDSPIKEDDLADVPDHEAAKPTDGFPPPLQYYSMPGKGL